MGISPWRRLDREPVEQGDESPPVAVLADHAAAVMEPQLSARERRWAGAVEEAGEEAEGGAGPRAPLPLQGDAFARAEGCGVTDAPAAAETDVPAAADENHLSFILNSDDDQL